MADESCVLSKNITYYLLEHEVNERIIMAVNGAYSQTPFMVHLLLKEKEEMCLYNLYAC